MTTLLTNLLFLTLCAPSVVMGEAASSDVEVEAQRVELDRERGEALFVGSVILRHGGLELRCERLRAQIGEGGRLSALEAAGAVRITVRGLHATSGSARYDPTSGRVMLGGEPSVRRGSSVLRGRSIIVDINSGRVTIEEAHGVFHIGS